MVSTELLIGGMIRRPQGLDTIYYLVSHSTIFNQRKFYYKEIVTIDNNGHYACVLIKFL